MLLSIGRWAECAFFVFILYFAFSRLFRVFGLVSHDRFCITGMRRHWLRNSRGVWSLVRYVVHRHQEIDNNSVTPSSSTSGCLSGDDTSEDCYLPSCLEQKNYNPL